LEERLHQVESALEPCPHDAMPRGAQLPEDIRFYPEPFELPEPAATEVELVRRLIAQARAPGSSRSAGYACRRPRILVSLAFPPHLHAPEDQRTYGADNHNDRDQHGNGGHVYPRSVGRPPNLLVYSSAFDRRDWTEGAQKDRGRTWRGPGRCQSRCGRVLDSDPNQFVQSQLGLVRAAFHRYRKTVMTVPVLSPSGS